MSILIKKIKNLKPVVLKCLEQIPETRDDDRLLILKIWAHQNPDLRNNDYSFIDFAGGFLKNSYADPESIRRTRQKLQQEIPEVRGKLYSQRHKEACEVRSEIKKT